MSQYVLLRKPNDSLNSLIGKSFNQKSKFEANKILDEIHSKAESRLIAKSALCYVLDKNEIKGVGGSTMLKDKNGKIISNLILDQFGLLMSKIFATLTTGNQLVTINNTINVGVPINARALTSNVWNITSGGAVGTTLFVGSGSTPPARTDFTLATPFVIAPENNVFASNFPIWNSGLGNCKNVGSIIAGGSGTINESALIQTWRTGASGLSTFALFRDIISPAQSFIAGQSIALEYTVQL